jgi:hypothetical protein
MPRGLARLTIAQIHAEIRRRERSVVPLERRRATLLGRIARLDDQIRAAGGSPNGRAGRRAGGGRRRPRNEMTLSEALAKALRGKTVSVTDAAAAVQRAGYRTNSSNFRTQVNIALIKGPFKRMGRGQYTAK